MHTCTHTISAAPRARLHFSPIRLRGHALDVQFLVLADSARCTVPRAYRLTIKGVSITGIPIGIYAKGADNLRLESNVIRANMAIIAEDCGDSTFSNNDLYPFNWGVILRGWSGDSLLQRNVFTGMPLIDPHNPNCAKARVAFPSEPSRQCDPIMRLPASAGILIDAAAESCTWANCSAVFPNLWPNCLGHSNPKNLLTGNPNAVTVESCQFHGVRSVVARTGSDPAVPRQLTFRGNNLMNPLGELGFRSDGHGGDGCNFTFPCVRCVCYNNVNHTPNNHSGSRGLPAL